VKSNLREGKPRGEFEDASNKSLDGSGKQRLCFLCWLVCVCRPVTSAVRCFPVKMKQPFLIIILWLQVFNVSCTQDMKPNVSQPTNNANLTIAPNQKLIIPDGWKKIEECGLSFYAPSNLKEIKVQPYDSCAKQYRNKNIVFSLDLIENGGSESSSRSGEYSDEKDFQIVKTIIDGQKAELITYYLSNDGGFKERQDLFYGAVLYVPLIDKNDDNLTIWTYSRTAEDREIAKQIFETIHFEN